MISRIALAAAFLLLIACGETPPAAVGTGGSVGSVQGGSISAGGSAAGTASGGQNAGSSPGGAATGGAGAAGMSAGSGGNAGTAGGGTGGGGSGGGGSGGGGSGGGGGGSGGGPSLVQPISRGDLDVLEFGDLYFAVKPGTGARVVSFKLGGDELLTGPNEHPNYYGSTLWTSPADDWVPASGFMPPAAVDNAPYTATVSADGVITATSTSYTTPKPANAPKQFVVTKSFHADLAKNAIVIDYGLKNTGATAYPLSHWEVTRVFTGGMMFFQSGAAPKLDFLPQLVHTTDAGGYTWWDNTTHIVNQGESKGGADSPGGFIAQVSPHQNGDLLFIKSFKVITKAAAPTGHYPIEFYCNNPHTYVELEAHSSYDMIAPGASYTATYTWYLKRLPVGTDRSAGSAALIAAVKSTLGK